MVREIIELLGLCIIFYLLYMNGIMVTKKTRAFMYSESMKGRKASFGSCHGFIRRIIKFKKSGMYEFIFTPELSYGEVSVELLDSKKKIILSLDGTNLSASINLIKHKKYYLVFRFNEASGKYVLNYNYKSEFGEEDI